MPVRRLGLLRRVQPDRRFGPLGDIDSATVYTQRAADEAQEVHGESFNVYRTM